MFDNGSYLRRRRRFKKSDLSSKGGRHAQSGLIKPGGVSRAELTPPLPHSLQPPQQPHPHSLSKPNAASAYDKPAYEGDAYLATPTTSADSLSEYYYRQAARQALHNPSYAAYAVGGVGAAEISRGAASLAPASQYAAASQFSSQFAYYAAAAYPPTLNPSPRDTSGGAPPTLDHASHSRDNASSSLNQLPPSLDHAHSSLEHAHSSLDHAHSSLDPAHSTLDHAPSSGTSSPESERPTPAPSAALQHQVRQHQHPQHQQHHLHQQQQWPSGFAGSTATGHHWPEYITQY